MVWHFEDSVTVWFGMQIGSTLLEECTVFVFRPKCGGKVSLWDVGHQTTFLGAFARLLKSSCYHSHVCPSVCLHVTNRLPQNVMFEYFLEICQGNWNFHSNLTRIMSAAHEQQCCTRTALLHTNSRAAHEQRYNCMITYLCCHFFSKWEIFHTKFV